MLIKNRKRLPQKEAGNEKLRVRLREEIEIASISNIGKRGGQEDSFGVSDWHDKTLVADNGILALVADGMGGLEGGEEASWITASTFLEYFTNRTLEDDILVSQALVLMVQMANANVLSHIRKKGGGMSGSTVVATVIKDRKLHFVSVGDSRIYLVRNGGLLQLNREHIYARQLDIAAASEGESSLHSTLMNRERKSLTNYIGMDRIEEIDYNLNPIDLISDDRILLMSDGVFGTISEAEIIAAAAGQPPQEATERLQRAVLSHEKQTQDNFTAICIAVR